MARVVISEDRMNAKFLATGISSVCFTVRRLLRHRSLRNPPVNAFFFEDVARS